MIIAALAILGVIFGSFVNALVWRFHEQEVLRGRKKRPTRRQLAAISLLHGRSMCPDCRHELGPLDLVPVVSWLALGGRCRYCRRPISWQYPLVELLTGALFALSYIYWPLQLSGSGLFQLICWLAVLVVFVALAVYDLRWFLLPDRLVYPLTAFVLLETIVVAIVQRDAVVLLNAALGALVIAGLFYGLFQVSGGKWIGGGDVKLAVALGLLAGTALKAVLVIFLASVIGTAVSLPLTVKAKKGLNTRVPFGPFLLAATIVTVLFGASLIHWYRHFLSLG